MPNVNKVILIGHLTRDPQLKYLPSKTAVAEFGIAVSRKWKTPTGEAKEEVAFVDCACFGKSGETLAQYTTKGKAIYLEGRLKLDSWEDKNGGGKRNKLSVIVEQFQFLHARPAGDADSAPAAVGAAKNPGPPFGDEKIFDDSEIPW